MFTCNFTYYAHTVPVFGGHPSCPQSSPIVAEDTFPSHFFGYRALLKTDKNGQARIAKFFFKGQLGDSWIITHKYPRAIGLI